MTIFNVIFKTGGKVILIYLLLSSLKIFHKILSKYKDNRRSHLYLKKIVVKEAILNFPLTGKY